MGFLRHLFRESEQGGEPSIAPDKPPVETLEPESIELSVREPLPSCPSCGYVLDPPPVRGRRCPSCRQPIVVRHADGRPVFLVESAVPIFDRERQRIADETTWTVDRERWLSLAESVHAPAAKRESLAVADLSAAVVDAARALYLASVEDAVRLARRAKRWPEVARIRRQQAAALFVEAGSPVPPSADIVERQRDGMLAELRALQAGYAYAELVSAGCCRICRVDDGKVFKIAAELRTPRLPHPGCTKGLCACEWWLAMPVPKKRRRSARRQRATPTDTQVVSVGAGTAVDAMGDREDRPAGPEPAD